MNIIKDSSYWNEKNDYTKINSVQKVFGLQSLCEDNIASDCGGSGGCSDSGCSAASCSSCASPE